MGDNSVYTRAGCRYAIDGVLRGSHWDKALLYTLANRFHHWLVPVRPLLEPAHSYHLPHIARAGRSIPVPALNHLALSRIPTQRAWPRLRYTGYSDSTGTSARTNPGWLYRYLRELAIDLLRQRANRHRWCSDGNFPYARLPPGCTYEL